MVIFINITLYETNPNFMLVLDMSDITETKTYNTISDIFIAFGGTT